MTRSTNMEHVEVLERLRGVLEHGKMGDKCLIAPDLVTAAIAALSAPKPPARMAEIPEPSPDGWLQAGGLLYRLTEGHRPQNRDEINVTMVHGSREPAHCEARAAEILAMLQSQPPAEAQPCGCGEATCTVPWEPGCGLGKSEQHAVVEASPPSAPVGAEGVRRYLAARDAKPIRGMDPDVIHAIHTGTEWEAELCMSDLRALAQQPTSDGGFTAADMMDARQEGRKEAQQPAGPTWIGIDWAEGQQPAAVDGACAWNADDDGVWHGSCGAAWCLEDGGPAENSMRHCPQCGKQIALAGQPGGSDNDR